MAISATQADRLKAGLQKFTAQFAIFDAPSISFSNDSGGALADHPLVVIMPRYAIVAPSATLQLDASGSIDVPGGGITAYSWTIVSGGGSLSSTTIANPIFTAPASTDTTKLSCQVTGANGTTTGYCYIRTQSSGQDIAEITACKGSATGFKGWQLKAKLPKPASVSDFAQDKILVFHVDDTWDGTSDTFSSYGRPQNVMIGIVRKGSAHESADHKWVVVDVESPTVLLKGNTARIEETLWSQTASTGVHSTANFTPTDAIFHLLRHHTTWWEYFNVYKLFDDYGNPVANLKVQAGPVLDLIEDIAARTLCVIFCDRHGQMLVVPDIDARYDDYYWSSRGSAMTFVEDHWLDIDAEYIRPDQVTQVNASGIKSDLTEIAGGYPVTHSAGGWPVTGKNVKGLICDSESTLDDWAHGLYNKENVDYLVTLQLPLNHSFDIYDEIAITWTSEQTGVGINWVASTFWITDISYAIDLDTRQWRTTFKLRLLMENVS